MMSKANRGEWGEPMQRFVFSAKEDCMLQIQTASATWKNGWI